jgi:hypothetical protein
MKGEEFFLRRPHDRNLLTILNYLHCSSHMLLVLVLLATRQQLYTVLDGYGYYH